MNQNSPQSQPLRIKRKTAARKPETNEQFLRRIMTFSRSGALMQGFIMDTLARHAKMVAETPIEVVREKLKDSAVHPDAWHATAKELHDEIEKHFGHR